MIQNIRISKYIMKLYLGVLSHGSSRYSICETINDQTCSFSSIDDDKNPL